MHFHYIFLCDRWEINQSSYAREMSVRLFAKMHTNTPMCTHTKIQAGDIEGKLISRVEQRGHSNGTN